MSSDKVVEPGGLLAILGGLAVVLICFGALLIPIFGLIETGGWSGFKARLAQNISVVALEYPQNVVLAISQNHELLRSVG